MEYCAWDCSLKGVVKCVSRWTSAEHVSVVPGRDDNKC
jgi:hypothetical protein